MLPKDDNDGCLILDCIVSEDFFRIWFESGGSGSRGGWPQSEMETIEFVWKILNWSSFYIYHSPLLADRSSLNTYKCNYFRELIDTFFSSLPAICIEMMNNMKQLDTLSGRLRWCTTPSPSIMHQRVFSDSTTGNPNYTCLAADSGQKK